MCRHTMLRQAHKESDRKALTTDMDPLRKKLGSHRQTRENTGKQTRKGQRDQ